MAVNKLLPFANGESANVVDYATWSALTQILGQGFVTGVARSDYANRLFSQGALASYILGQFVVDETEQDADLNESTFYVNFKNALINYIKANAVSLDTAQTVGGVKTFTSSPIVPTADSADNSQNVANTAFVQGEIASKANDSDVVKLTSNQTIAGVKTFSDSPEVPTASEGDNSQKTASTGFVQNAIATQTPSMITQAFASHQTAYFDGKRRASGTAAADSTDHTPASVTLDQTIAKLWLVYAHVSSSHNGASSVMSLKITRTPSDTVWATPMYIRGTEIYGGGLFASCVIDATNNPTANAVVYCNSGASNTLTVNIWAVPII